MALRSYQRNLGRHFFKGKVNFRPVRLRTNLVSVMWANEASRILCYFEMACKSTERSRVSVTSQCLFTMSVESNVVFHLCLAIFYLFIKGRWSYTLKICQLPEFKSVTSSCHIVPKYICYDWKGLMCASDSGLYNRTYWQRSLEFVGATRVTREERVKENSRACPIRALPDV